MPSPIPTYTVQFPTSSRSPHHGHEISQGHTHYRIRTKSNETRRVHYADENPYPHGASRTIHVSSTVQRDRAEGSQQYRAIAVPVHTRQPNDSHRRRVNSTGSALPRSVTPLPAAQHQRSGRFEYSKCTGRKKAVCVSGRRVLTSYERCGAELCLRRSVSIILGRSASCRVVLMTS